MLKCQRKERDALGDTVYLDAGLGELTGGSIQKQREAKPRAGDADYGCFGGCS